MKIQQIEVDLVNFAYDLVHSGTEFVATFGEGSDTCHQVWVTWDNPGFNIDVTTFQFRGSVPSSRLYPQENCYSELDDAYYVLKVRDIIDKLKTEYGLDFTEAI